MRNTGYTEKRYKIECKSTQFPYGDEKSLQFYEFSPGLSTIFCPRCGKYIKPTQTPRICVGFSRLRNLYYNIVITASCIFIMMQSDEGRWSRAPRSGQSQRGRGDRTTVKSFPGTKKPSTRKKVRWLPGKLTERKAAFLFPYFLWARAKENRAAGGGTG